MYSVNLLHSSAIKGRQGSESFNLREKVCSLLANTSGLRKAPLQMSHARDRESEEVERKKARAQKRRRWESLFRDDWRLRSPRTIYGHYTKGNKTCSIRSWGLTNISV